MSEQDATDADGSDGGESTGVDDEPDEAVETDDEPDETVETDDVSTGEDGGVTDDAGGDASLADLVNDVAPDDEGADETPSVPDPEDVDVDGDLVERVRDAPEETARAVTLLRKRVDALESQLDSRKAEVEDLESRLKRKQADFQNYKKRQKERMEEEKQRATEDLVGRLLDVRDNLERALDQEDGVDIRGGVETTLTQFDEQLQRENVERVEPQPGEAVDPQRHKALATVASDQPADTVAEVHRPGYEMAGTVIRPAQVTVSDGSDAGNDRDGTGDEATAGDGDADDGDGEATAGDGDADDGDGEATAGDGPETPR